MTQTEAWADFPLPASPNGPNGALPRPDSGNVRGPCSRESGSLTRPSPIVCGPPA